MSNVANLNYEETLMKKISTETNVKSLEEKSNSLQKEIKTLEKKKEGLIEELKKKEKYFATLELRSFNFLTEDEFLRYIEVLLQKLGYENVEEYSKMIYAIKDDSKYLIKVVKRDEGELLGEEIIEEFIKEKENLEYDKGVILTNQYFTKLVTQSAVLNFISIWDRNKLEDFIYQSYGFINNNIEYYQTTREEFDFYDNDPYFEECVNYIMEIGKVSTSIIQRKFKLGYNRAAKLLDKLEILGFVSGYMGSKPREVLITKEMWEDYKKKMVLK